MYATCLFCNAPLGRNETLEPFPVGRRLAYDAARGRLWVVCRRCERWNLSPVEERWEAIEAAERLYRGTRLRAATDQVGLARVGDGLELVRIGRPLRPEFAAWRYGDQFGRRRRRQIAWAGAGLAAIGAVAVGGASIGIGVGSFLWIGQRAAQRALHGSPDAVVARMTAAGRGVALTRKDLAQVRIRGEEDRPFGVEVPDGSRRLLLEGEEAVRVVGRLIPAVNRFGAAPAAVREAVDALERAGGPEGYLAGLRRRAAATRSRAGKTESWWGADEIPRTGLYALGATDRIALEMAAHEEQERQALEGELAALERAWRDAEEIAAIADDLLVPGSVRQRLDALGARPPREP
jgi:hypothetical protein